MSRINLLDSAVFNRIAAGEVVERPRSIVKELMENSIDAGATFISVEIINGGLSQIRVVDNGCGIESEDIEKAFLPHATSKIKNLNDLNSIATLGFRGEALTSIASVAKVTLTSRAVGSAIGNYVVIENGVIIDRGEKGCSQGTTIVVEDLFKNIPARAKFLSKPSVEESVITDTVSRLIMTNPNIGIKYSAGGKVVYHSSGDNLKNAIYTVYGKTFVDNMVPIEYVMSNITLKGYINKPYYTKPNRTYQTLIVNGRYVENADISYCIYNCYRDFLMKRQFPAFVLTLDLPYDMVDVNVHPNKLEVKFAGADELKRVIYSTVKDKLDELTQAPKEIIKNYNENETNQPVIFKYAVDESVDGAKVCKDVHKDVLGVFLNVEGEIGKSNSSAVIRSAVPELSEHRETEYLSASKYFGKTNIEDVFASEEICTTLDKNCGLGNDADCIDSSCGSENGQINTEDDLRIICEKDRVMKRKFKTVLFDTYIVVEDGTDVLLIDQHAAHERLLYDKLAEQIERRKVEMQDMLVPYTFDVTPVETELLKERLNEINACGFVLSSLGGNTFSLSAVPLACSEMRFDGFMELVLGELNGGKIRKVDFVKDIIMQSACKAAVKGEDKLSDSEIDRLLAAFADGDKVLMCPHGRPLVVKISKSEIEKWFKRVV
ncbi:MAG: DNA mismatch repair endonuclease MutL [Clostridia bacterium]|nr:DNA mismatch repair endonuclease MutL [Clostridia bacterium]